MGIGNDGDNKLSAARENDTRLVGRAGVVFLQGSTGDDTLIGGDSADTVLGGRGSNFFVIQGAGDVAVGGNRHSGYDTANL
jgi:Ca2+-binding RTX toxin-like protein